MNEIIIDLSPVQKRLRVSKMRAELLTLGYSVVTTEWLHGVLGEMTLAGMRRGATLMEAAE